MSVYRKFQTALGVGSFITLLSLPVSTEAQLYPKLQKSYGAYYTELTGYLQKIGKLPSPVPLKPASKGETTLEYFDRALKEICQDEWMGEGLYNKEKGTCEYDGRPN